VVREIEDTEVSVTDDIEMSGTLYLNDSVCAPLLGVSWMYDQPRSGGGGWRNQYDGDEDPTTTPTFPTSETDIKWGFDKTYLCPLDDITVIVTKEFASTFNIGFDTVFAFDTPVQGKITFEETSPASIPVSPGLSMTATSNNVIDVNGNVVKLRFITLGNPGTDPTDYQVVVSINGTPQATENFTAGTNTEIVRTLSVPVVVSDVVTVAVQVASGGARTPSWSKILATVTQEASSLWSYGDTLNPGIYSLEKTPS
jgi:hypothetical protein